MIHRQRHHPQPIRFVVLMLFSFSCSKASSFGTPRSSNSCSSSSRIRSSSSSINSSFRSNMKKIPTGTGTGLASSSFQPSFQPLLLRGGSDSEGSPIETGAAASTAAAALQEPTSTALSATSTSTSDSESDSSTSTSVSTSASTSATTSASVSTSASTSMMGPNASPPGFLRSLFPSIPWHTLPNLLTYARCIAIPALVLHFYLSNASNTNIISSLIFAIASITDYLDGYLARRWDICSPFGAFLDPVADKLMVSTALILLTGKYGYVVAVPSAVILAREIAVSALREWMASKGKRDSVKVGFQGKVKTAATMVALTIVLSVPDSVGLSWVPSQLVSLTGGWLSGGWPLLMNLGMSLLFLSSFVTVTSGSVYFRAAAPVLMGKED